MFWLKRVFCGLIAILFLIIGIKLIDDLQQAWQIFGFCFLVVGISLFYITVMQVLPPYSFWITLTALALAYSLFTLKFSQKEEVYVEEITPKIQKEEVSTTQKKKISKPVKKKKKKKTFKFSSYPSIQGPASVIHAHVLYIGGRYVRLFGVDAPDSDQICSDSMGRSYNCGEEAISWLRGWIDNNPITCYLLKVNPNGRDLATCVFGDYDIGAALVQVGWGIANAAETDVYVPYENEAKSKSSGLWQGTFYSPEDWRDIKRSQNDFKIKRSSKSSGGFFSSWF